MSVVSVPCALCSRSSFVTPGCSVLAEPATGVVKNAVVRIRAMTVGDSRSHGPHDLIAIQGSANDADCQPSAGTPVEPLCRHGESAVRMARCSAHPISTVAASHASTSVERFRFDPISREGCALLPALPEQCVPRGDTATSMRDSLSRQS